MQTSSSAKRTWSDSRSASLYTATVETPSSRQARITRSAISPRLAIRTFLNMPRPRDRRSEHLGRQIERLRRCFFGGDLVELPIRGRLHAGNAKGELVGVGGVEQRAFVRDQSVLEPLHQRLIEGLHPVGYRTLGDQIGNVKGLLDVAYIVRHCRGVDQHLRSGNSAPAVGPGHQAER